METYLTVNDAARVLGVTETTVRNLMHRGDLPVIARTESGISLVRRADAESLAVKRAAEGKRGAKSVAVLVEAGS